MTVGAVIQARVGSTRLPAKVLLELPFGSGISVLQHVIRRAKKATSISRIVVATTTLEEDRLVESEALKEGVKAIRGEKEDLPARWLRAAESEGMDVIVRLTSDNPCIDPNLIDYAVEEHIKMGNDYSYADFPLGLNFDIISTSALEKLIKATSKRFREGKKVMSFEILKDKLGVKIGKIFPPEFLKSLESVRLTLDTEEDYALLCAVFEFLYPQNNFFTAEDLIKLFKNKPWLRLINKKVNQKKVLSSLKEELEEAKRILKMQDLNRVLKLLEKLEERMDDFI